MTKDSETEKILSVSGDRFVYAAVFFAARYLTCSVEKFGLSGRGLSNSNFLRVFRVGG